MAQDRKLSHRENVQARVWLVGTTRRPKKDSPQFSRRPVWHVGDIAIEVGTRPTVTFGINLVPKIVPLPHSSSNSIRIYEIRLPAKVLSGSQSFIWQGKFSNVDYFHYIVFFCQLILFFLPLIDRWLLQHTCYVSLTCFLRLPLSQHMLNRIAYMEHID